MRPMRMLLPLVGMAVSCVSAKTTLKDYTTLGATPFEYVEKNASHTHTTAKALCIFGGVPFLGVGPMYEELHSKYTLAPNEAFINQRFDTVRKFYIFYCERNYTLSADIVRFSFQEPTPVVQAAPQPPPAPPVAPVKPAQPTSGPVTVEATGELTVACSRANPVTGRPNPSTGKTTVRLYFEQSDACTIQMGDHLIRTILSPGGKHRCHTSGGQLQCNTLAEQDSGRSQHRMRYSPGEPGGR